MRLDGKVALITGASQGIGAACAAAFRKRGARLSLTARSEKRLRQVADADDLLTPGDITDPETRRTVVDRTLERFGTIDVLVNNAGVGLYAPAWCAPLKEAHEMFELNVFAPLEMIQLVAPHMRRQKSGSIVNVGSIAGKLTLPWFTLYSATKYAIGSITDGLRTELKKDGIHAMQVCPGYVRTQFQNHALTGRPAEPVPASRRFVITAEQCAEAIVRGVERGARTVVVPRIGWLLIALARLFPRLVDARLASMYASSAQPA